MKTACQNVNRANQYARDVVRGKIVACRLVKLACQRHLDDLEKAKSKSYPYRFDREKADRACRFIQLLPHTKGEWAFKRQLLTLEPWQLFGMAAVFGWVRKKDGLRRFRTVYKQVPRKNGKSADASGVGNYMFCADNEFGAEVYCGATTERQAWEVFRPARLMCQRTPMLIEAFGIEVNAKNLNRPSDGARFEPVIGKPGDGSSPSCALIDEYHEHDTTELVDTMLTGMGARRQPLLYIITTAGFNIDGPCYQQFRQAVEMLEGVTPDEELFALIYTIDETDDWTDPSVLAKANPNMGVSVYEDYLISQQRRALRDPAFASTFKTKHLNIWVSARAAYYNLQDWQELEDKGLSLDEFEGQECWVSVDLASTTDIAATVMLFRRDIDGKAHYYVFADCWVPDDALHNEDAKELAQRYQRWLKGGWLNTCDGAEIDFNDIRDHILCQSHRHNIVEVPHDPWQAHQTMKDLESEGLLPVKIPQTTAHFSPAMKELKSAIAAKRIHHNGNPALTWMLGNVVAKEDANENVFPRKDKADAKIDAAVALIMAIGRAMLGEVQFNPLDDYDPSELIL